VAAAQHASPAAQHVSPTAQQSVVFAFAFTEAQQACGGTQQSSPAAQQSALGTATDAWTLAKQHSCGGLQQAASGAQQLTFELDSASLQAAPPPIVPRSRVKGANNFTYIINLQSFKKSGKGREIARIETAAARQFTGCPPNAVRCAD
jgi:hypothetical protein